LKTKIFLAFIAVILTALLSNFIFETLIMKDFDSYVNGVKEDQFYWVLASIEGSYSGGKWDKGSLSEAIHWAMMLGLNVKILDDSEGEVISSQEIMSSLSESMKQRMSEHFKIHAHGADGKFTDYPLYSKGKKIGTLLSQPFQKRELLEKESIFKKRTKNFLYISFLIAGGGSLLIAFFLSRFLSKPIMSLKTAAEKIAKGDLTARTALTSADEVGELSKSFNKMAESLQKEEELRKHLFSNVAHELRTPLTILKTHAEAMADGVIEREKGLENIKNEIERLIRLVKGIEDITAAEASFFAKGETVEINLREFLSEICDEMLPAFKKKGLDIKILNKDDIFISADIEKLERIIRNIISNSLKFTDKGGIEIDYGTEAEMFFVGIKDTGRGIPEDELPLIFNRFYKGARSYNESLGLGLAIVRELVDVMAGRIEVKSTIDKGTTFRVYLPIKKN